MPRDKRKREVIVISDDDDGEEPNIQVIVKGGTRVVIRLPTKKKTKTEKEAKVPAR